MSEVTAHGDIILSSPTDIEMGSLLALRSALSLEIRTGLRVGRRNLVAIAQQRGLTTATTRKGAWQDVDLAIREKGGPAALSAPIPHGKTEPIPALPQVATA